MLSTHADFEPGTRLPPPLERHLDQLAHPLLVYRCERVRRQDPFFEVHGKEAGLGVVAREAQGGLREVVAADAEELGESWGGEGGSCESSGSLKEGK